MIIKPCDCAMGEHKAPVEAYEISCGAIEKLPQILKEYHRIYLVADLNTYEVAGRRAEQLLKENGMYFGTCLLKQETVLPDAQTVGEIFVRLYDLESKPNIFAFPPLPDLILAVGSGTINDCCRIVSYRLGLPYGVLGTAPSMDGYLSAGTPYLHDGTKTTVCGTTPRYFIADLDVMKNAPYDMLLAGIGDMFGKYTGLLDWEMAREYKGEYFCPQIAADVLDATNKCLEQGYRLKERSPEAIGLINEGFAITGLGMAFTGNSRPASGSEHILAHAWELFDVEAGHKPNLHGLEVCQATRLIAKMYRFLYEETEDTLCKSLIAKYLPLFDGVEQFCVDMKVPLVVTDKQRMIDGFWRALAMRDRYTILFYLRDRGLLEAYIQKTVDAFCAEMQA